MSESPYAAGVNPSGCGRIGGGITSGPESAGNALCPALTPDHAEAGMNDSKVTQDPADTKGRVPVCAPHPDGLCRECFTTGHAHDHDPTEPCPAQAVTFAPDGWDERTEAPVDEQVESLAKADPPPPETSVIAECQCWVTPEWQWTKHYGAVEPGSQWEPNPECPVHFPNRPVQSNG